MEEVKEFVGTTREEAIAKAAGFFGVPQDQLNVRVMPEGISGLGGRALVLASVGEAPQAELGPVGSFIGWLRRPPPRAPD